MYDRSLTIEQNLTMLEAAPLRIAEITKGLSPTQLLTPPEPGEWAARDVLAHLRACSDMWGKYIVKILNDDHPTFKAVNPTTWIKSTNYLEFEFRPSLRAFTAQRAELLAVLKAFVTRRLVSGCNSNGGGKATRTNRAHICPVAGKP